MALWLEGSHSEKKNKSILLSSLRIWIFGGSCSNATEQVSFTCVYKNILLIFWFAFLLFALFCALFVKISFLSLFRRVLLLFFSSLLKLLLIFIRFCWGHSRDGSTKSAHTHTNITSSSSSLSCGVLNCSDFIVHIHVFSCRPHLLLLLASKLLFFFTFVSSFH